MALVAVLHRCLRWLSVIREAWCLLELLLPHPPAPLLLDLLAQIMHVVLHFLLSPLDLSSGLLLKLLLGNSRLLFPPEPGLLSLFETMLVLILDLLPEVVGVEGFCDPHLRFEGCKRLSELHHPGLLELAFMAVGVVADLLTKGVMVVSHEFGAVSLA